jgi:hypothetical protein
MTGNLRSWIENSSRLSINPKYFKVYNKRRGSIYVLTNIIARMMYSCLLGIWLGTKMKYSSAPIVLYKIGWKI